MKSIPIYWYYTCYIVQSHISAPSLKSNSPFFFSRGRKPSSSEWGFLGVVPQLGASLVRWFWAPWRGLFSLDKNPSPWKNSYEHLEGWRKTNRSLEGRWLQSFLISYFLLKLNYSRIYRILILNHVGFSRWLVGFPAAGWCFRKKSGPENIFLPQGISLLSTNQPLFFFWCFFFTKIWSDIWAGSYHKMKGE